MDVVVQRFVRFLGCSLKTMNWWKIQDPGPAATKHSWVQNSASTLRKYSTPYSQPQITATKYLSTYSNKNFEYVLKIFEIARYLSQVNTQAIKMAVHRRHMRRRRRQMLDEVKISRRVIRDRLNPLEEYSDDEIFDRYRFRPATIQYILDSIAPSIVHNTPRTVPYHPLYSYLPALGFWQRGHTTDW